MVIRFSDLFRAGDEASDTADAARARIALELESDAGSDGVTVEAESYRQNADGSESYERTSVETGRTELESDASMDADTASRDDASGSAEDDGSDAGENAAQANDSAGASSDANASSEAAAGNDGIRIENESYSRDENGDVSYDATGLDTGGTDFGFGFDADQAGNGLSALSIVEDEGHGLG